MSTSVVGWCRLLVPAYSWTYPRSQLAIPAHSVSTDQETHPRALHTAWQLQELAVCGDKTVYHRLQFQDPCTVQLHYIGLSHTPRKFFVSCSGGVYLGLRVGAGRGSSSASSGTSLSFDWPRGCGRIPENQSSKRAMRLVNAL